MMLMWSTRVCVVVEVRLDSLAARAAETSGVVCVWMHAMMSWCWSVESEEVDAEDSAISVTVEGDALLLQLMILLFVLWLSVEEEAWLVRMKEVQHDSSARKRRVWVSASGTMSTHENPSEPHVPRSVLRRS
mmetsp:Transcript_4799/g.10257  ORF Transcript_4799/g.10257 Transcript_4799/m.10257 type:complete len:132 (-) Transcript_4799:284-679(-)